MIIDQRKKAFVSLGQFMGQFTTAGIEKNPQVPNNDLFFDRMSDAISMAVHHNGWFIRENVFYAMEQWSKALTMENLDKWLSHYPLENAVQKSIGVVMAGNIPLVGFHDFLCVLMCGHRVQAKLSSNDQLLLPLIADYLRSLDPEWEERIIFIGSDQEGPQKMEGYDAVIATGSNNTARYFEYYFSDKPRIIRKNRNSVAVLTGKESPGQLAALGEDIFRYYGLGCRNVSKLYVPEGYNFDAFFEAIYPWNSIINQAKYANNYDYNKAVYLMSQYQLLENGFLILKQDASFGSPIATLFYEPYDNVEQLKQNLEGHKNQIQCIVSDGIFNDEVAFGTTQQPKLWDYADNVDTLSFLIRNV